MTVATLPQPQAAPVPSPQATPVMAQFFEMKAKQPDALLFFRMGDFYELFFEDADKAAAALGIALTKRGKHAGEDIPMAGVPVHAAEAYLAKLIRAGFKVAVCEQVEAPAEARKRGPKAVVRRDVVRVVTPGTLTEDALLDARGANRLAALSSRGGDLALASLDLSTGEVEVAAVERGDLAGALAALAPSELLVLERLFADPDVAAALKTCPAAVGPMASPLGEPGASRARLQRLYGVATLDGFGAFAAAEVSALGLLAAHLETTQPGGTPALRPPRRGGLAESLAIDPATRASLEIDRAQNGGREGSLLACVDRTTTPGGARLLGARLARPLTDRGGIEARLDAVAWFAERRGLREAVRAELKTAGDPARALSRLALGRGGPRDLGALRGALRAGEAIGSATATLSEPLNTPPAEIEAAVAALTLPLRPELAAFARDLDEALAPELPVQARDGGWVCVGCRPELDEARTLRDDSRRFVAALEGRLRAETGVASLKAKHNAVLGYFVECAAKAGEPLLREPFDRQFIHRQTLPDRIRFSTAELAALDAKISQAGDRALALELETFEAFRERARALASQLQDVAEALDGLDVAAALAEWAIEVGGVRPELDDGAAFEAEGARHPVVEAALKRTGGRFVPNDLKLDGGGQGCPRLAIVTGPNMAGKSTFLRQNALLVVLAQAGSFVPAMRLRLGVVDRLFSRVGAGDDLARGRSTFMTEMVETAAILTQATARSFVVLDEIGRGTATWDGLAIAWACAEALHDRIGARALFATHYHELAALEGRLGACANLSMQAREWNGELVFLHEAAAGAADRSYGVQVARLAGVPAAVVARAREVLNGLEAERGPRARLDDLPLFAAAFGVTPLAGVAEPSALEQAVASLDPDDLSPREALDALFRLKALAGRG